MSSHISVPNPTGRLVAEHPGMVKLGRAGWAAKGVVYTIAGVLAATVVFAFARLVVTGPNQEASPNGAIKTIAGSPGGALLLWVLGALDAAVRRVAADVGAAAGRPRRRGVGEADRLRRQRRHLHDLRHHGASRWRASGDASSAAGRRRERQGDQPDGARHGQRHRSLADRSRRPDRDRRRDLPLREGRHAGRRGRARSVRDVSGADRVDAPARRGRRDRPRDRDRRHRLLPAARRAPVRPEGSDRSRRRVASPGRADVGRARGRRDRARLRRLRRVLPGHVHPSTVAGTLDEPAVADPAQREPDPEDVRSARRPQRSILAVGRVSRSLERRCVRPGRPAGRIVVVGYVGMVAVLDRHRRAHRARRLLARPASVGRRRHELDGRPSHGVPRRPHRVPDPRSPTRWARGDRPRGRDRARRAAAVVGVADRPDRARARAGHVPHRQRHRRSTPSGRAEARFGAEHVELPVRAHRRDGRALGRDRAAVLLRVDVPLGASDGLHHRGRARRAPSARPRVPRHAPSQRRRLRRR